MSKKGFMIFAYNNEQHDYLKQAIYQADRITKYMDLPVTIVTNRESLGDQTTGYNVILTDAEAKGNRRMDKTKRDSAARWYNANRNDAYNLTPYNQTIVIDSDLVVCGDELKTLFYSPVSFLCHRDVFDVTNRNSFDGDKTFGQFKMPHYWATVIYFKKDSFAESIFENIAMIKEYWKFFSELYKFNPVLFRNDYAVSIALLMAYGHRQDAVPSIPYQLMTAGTDVAVKLDNKLNSVHLHYELLTNLGKGVPRSTLIAGRDIHILNKYSLEKEIDRNIQESI